eukprot:466628_1
MGIQINYAETTTYYPQLVFKYGPNNEYRLKISDCGTTTLSCNTFQCTSSTDCEASTKDTNGGYGIAMMVFDYARDVFECFNEYINEDPYIPPYYASGGSNKFWLKVHYGRNVENAGWYNGEYLYFGDGGNNFYPLISIDIMGHELAHGYTLQHSDLTYDKESGAMNEAFSDLVGEACQYHSTGSYNWEIGEDVVKPAFGQAALRYMNNPPNDGYSIDHYNDYTDSLNVHHSSGIYNKAF